jgi:predicted Rossmann-fold nucleotide-binding protein
MKFKNERLSYLVDAFEEVLKGKKLELNEKNQFVYDILAELAQKRIINEKPQEFLTSDSYKPIGDTSNTSLPYQITRSYLYYRDELDKVGVRNIRVIGSKLSKINESKIKKLDEASAAFILPRTPSLQGVYEFLYLLKRNLESPENSKEIFVDNKNNENDKNQIFELVLKEIGLSEDLLKHFKINNIKAEEGVAKIIASEISKSYRKNSSNLENEFEITKDSVIYLATTSDKKLWEATAFFENYGIRVKPLSNVIGNFKDADELHGTIESNAVGIEGENNSGKLKTVIKKIKQLDENELKEKIIKDGENPEKAIVLTDDRGSFYSEKLVLAYLKKYGHNLPKDISDLYFSKNSYEELIENKFFPGPEIKHIIDAAGGLTKFWKEMANLSENLNISERFAENAIAVALCPILDSYKLPLDRRILSISARKKFKFNDKPSPKLPYVESEQFTGPVYSEETLAAMLNRGDFRTYFEQTDIGQAYKGIVHNFGLKEIVSLKSEPYENYQIGYFSDNINDNIIGFKVNMLNSGDTEIATIADGLLKDNDCFIFDGNIKKEDFWKSLHAFNKIVVSKQTDPRDLNKKIVIHKPNEYFQKIIDLYGKGYDVGTIRQYPVRMFSVTNNDIELENLIDGHSRKYRPAKDFVYDYKNEPKRFDIEEGKEAVFIACSASSETVSNMELSTRTAFLLALSGRDIVYGSGDKKMMGGIYDGYFHAKEYAENNGIEFKSRLIASSTKNILKLETLYERMPEKLNADLFYLAETIDHREDCMFNSSTSGIILPGGAGTIKELSNFRQKAASSGRTYEIHVLNNAGAYDPLEEINADLNVKFYRNLENILQNTYKVEKKLDELGINYSSALEFLKEKLEPSTKQSEISKEDASLNGLKRP